MDRPAIQLTSASKQLGAARWPFQVFDTFAVVNAYGRGLLEPVASRQGPEWQTLRLHMTWRRDGNGWLQVANYLDLTQRIGAL